MSKRFKKQVVIQVFGKNKTSKRARMLPRLVFDGEYLNDLFDNSSQLDHLFNNPASIRRWK
ncbi:hypothetical protein [Fodinibius sp. AD559]|uniref:hypothetical protein n=1 Tax=Fodinibius sp. AD559 TaxID=3424179 RepID=UPI004046C75A